MNAPATVAPQRQLHPVTKLTQQLEERANEFRKALPSHISPEKLQRTIVTAATNNPDLLNADRQSLIVAAMKAAQDGLLPDGREAALVIFNNRKKDAQGKWHDHKIVQYMPMVYGLRKKIVQSGEVVSLQTGLVYRAEMEAGAFIYEIGMEPPIRHRPMLDLPGDELTDDKIVAAYSIAKMKDGTVAVEVMRRGEIDRVRNVSMTGSTVDRYGKPRDPKGPWVDWFGEMARKTVMRRHSKTLPMSGDIIVDVEASEMEAASRAAALLDSVTPDAPVALPSNEQLGAQLEDHSGTSNGVPFDPETGELLARDSRGMTEVVEATPPNADAIPAAHEPEGRAAEDMGEANSDSEQPAWWNLVGGMKANLDAATTLAAIKSVDDLFVKNLVALPDDVAADLQKRIDAARRRVKEA